MSHATRRTFLAGAGLTGLAATFPAAARAQLRPGEPESIIFNAKVYTVDDRAPRAAAFALRDGRFLAVGTNDAIKALSGPRTTLWDAQQMTIVPGFIDTHSHPGGETLLYEVIVGNPFRVEFVPISDIIAKLRERASKTPPGQWVTGYFYDDTKIKDGRPLNIQDLDKVSDRHPVVVNHRGGHSAIYNSFAFRQANITKDSTPPVGGTYDKDGNGNLNGRATDSAMGVLDKVGDRVTYAPEERAKRHLAGLEYMSKAFVRSGLTTVHHNSGNQLTALQDLRRAGCLLHRARYEPSVYDDGPEGLDALVAQGIQTGFGDDWIRVGAMSEWAVDGSFSERTMAMSTPYAGVSPPYKGNIMLSQQELDERVERMHRARIQVNCHANGDVAIDMYLTALERVHSRFPRPDARPKITHCTMVNADLIARMKRLDAVPSLFTTYAYYNADKFKMYGEKLMQNCMAFRSLLDAGVQVAAGSDFSPGPFDPLMGIQGMVTRKGWNGEIWGANQRVSVADAIRINSLNGAYNSSEEKTMGSISPGKLADYVVLEADPHSVDPETIQNIRIARTVVGGQVVYST